MESRTENDQMAEFFARWKPITGSQGCPAMDELIIMAGGKDQGSHQDHLKDCESCRKTVELLRQELDGAEDGLVQFLALTSRRRSEPRILLGRNWTNWLQRFAPWGPSVAYTAAGVLFLLPFLPLVWRSQPSGETGKPVQVVFRASPQEPVSVLATVRELEASSRQLASATTPLPEAVARQERNRLNALVAKTDWKRLRPESRGRLAKAVVTYNQNLEQIAPPKIDPIEYDDSKRLTEVLQALRDIQAPAPQGAPMGLTGSPAPLPSGFLSAAPNVTISDGEISLPNVVSPGEPSRTTQALKPVADRLQITLVLGSGESAVKIEPSPGPMRTVPVPGAGRHAAAAPPRKP